LRGVLGNSGVYENEQSNDKSQWSKIYGATKSFIAHTGFVDLRAIGYIVAIMKSSAVCLDTILTGVLFSAASIRVGIFIARSLPHKGSSLIKIWEALAGIPTRSFYFGCCSFHARTRESISGR
jgi:hypothetical protein